LFVASSSSTLYGICFCFLSPSQEKRREKKGVESLLFVLLLQEKIKTKVYESLIFPMGLYFYFSSKEKRNFLVNSWILFFSRKNLRQQICRNLFVCVCFFLGQQKEKNLWNLQSDELGEIMWKTISPHCTYSPCHGIYK
jgi:hypothetical protein